MTGTAASFGAAAAFAYLLLEVINPQSFGWTVVVSLPAARLAVVTAAVLAAAVVAGVFPGRLAASVDAAAALAEE
jgi:putative ABC transport system permease protein